MGFLTSAAISIVLVIGVSALGSELVRILARLRRIRKLAAARNSIETYHRYLVTFPQIEEKFLIDCHALIQEMVGIKDFPVDPTDHLWRTLELDQGNVEYRLEQVLGEQAKHFAMLYDDNGTAVSNVGELVRLLHARLVKLHVA